MSKKIINPKSEPKSDFQLLANAIMRPKKVATLQPKSLRRQRELHLNDLLVAREVHLYIDHTNKLWVNVNEQCVLRVARVKAVIVQNDSTVVTYK